MASLDFEIEKAAFRAYYEQNVTLLQRAQESFVALVNALVMTPGAIAVSKIEGRVKEKEECIRKFARKYQPALEERNEPYEIRSHLTDLIGLRIVCLYEDEVDKVEEVLRSHFEVIEVTDKVSAMESTEGSFGYKGLHMDLRLNPERRALPEYAHYAPLPFELQVRTIIQDSWSVLDHKIKYKKSIPNSLKRRINVLAALFELADREFREIRDSTAAELQRAPDETVTPLEEIGPPSSESASAPGRELNAFTFLKIASHFFRDFEFEDKKVDEFVQHIQEWSPGMNRTQFNRFLKDNIGRVKRYKQAFEATDSTNKLGPYTVIRHCLYLANKATFSKALSKVARESFESWLAQDGAGGYAEVAGPKGANPRSAARSEAGPNGSAREDD
jgi:ppGpp synthetase/RelA/SpoT-type nucleotidyltranferase